jgi:hypothetical protein
MPIVTNFGFRQKLSPDTRKEIEDKDLLGPLRGFVGDDRTRSWKGTGFNVIWRPNHGSQNGGKFFFLELNFTEETLDFNNITGSGIADRGELQEDIVLGGLAYLQQIKDRFDNSAQHFEPGVWASVPCTTDPSEPPTVVRMGSIPHGVTINLQGTARSVDAPQITPVSITPFTIGNPGHLVPFDEEQLSIPSASRTPLNQVVGLTQHQLNNLNLFLEQANTDLTFLEVMALDITSDTSANGSVPDAGGGVDSIAFLVGNPTPNAGVAAVTATFWIERVQDRHGRVFHQLQYTQNVLLNFGGLSWPHITVGTLRPAG